MKIYIVVTDVVNGVMYSHKSVNTRVVIRFLWHDVIHWKTATSYDKMSLQNHSILNLIQDLENFWNHKTQAHFEHGMSKKNEVGVET